MTDTRFYALKVAPQFELKAEEGLKKLGYEAFTPVEWKWKRVGDNAKVICPECEKDKVLLVKRVTARLSTWKCTNSDCTNTKPFEVQKGNRRRHWAFPVLVGYVFAEVAGHWREAHHHIASHEEHYHGMLGYRNGYGEVVAAPLRPTEVEELKAMSGRSVRYVGSITVGDAARVKDGPLQGQAGRVTEVNGNEAKLALKQKLLGMDVIRVSVDLLEAV